MIGYYIGTLHDAESLVKVCSKFDEDIDVIYQKQVIDAKSILGVASLMGHTVSLNVITDDNDVKEKFERELQKEMGNYEI